MSICTCTHGLACDTGSILHIKLRQMMSEQGQFNSSTRGNPLEFVKARKIFEQDTPTFDCGCGCQDVKICMYRV